jgi:excisionase family DNA binding protein
MKSSAWPEMIDSDTIPRSQIPALLAALAARLLVEPEPERPPAGNATAVALLDAAQMAERLCVPESWVRTEARAGRIPFVAVGRYIRFDPAAVRAILTNPGA